MHEISRHLINEAAGKLQDMGATDEANEVITLLAKYEGMRIKPWLAEDLIEKIVRLRFPPNPEWSDEIRERHFNHLKLALSLHHDVLNEEVKNVLVLVDSLQNKTS